MVEQAEVVQEIATSCHHGCPSTHSDHSCTNAQIFREGLLCEGQEVSFPALNQCSSKDEATTSPEGYTLSPFVPVHEDFAMAEEEHTSHEHEPEEGENQNNTCFSDSASDIGTLTDDEVRRAFLLSELNDCYDHYCSNAEFLEFIDHHSKDALLEWIGMLPDRELCASLGCKQPSPITGHHEGEMQQLLLGRASRADGIS